MGRTPKITNEAILEAARQVFLAQGIGASTLEIAERAGISEASIFKRFATKQALFLAAIGLSETPKWVKTLSTQTPTAAVKAELTDICVEMVAFYQAVLPRVLMMMAPGQLPPSPQGLPPPVRDSQLLAKFLEQAIAQGFLRPCDARTLAHMIIGAITNYVVTETMMNKLPTASRPSHKPLEPSHFIQNLIEIVWAGVAPESET
jgi:AcrR family transcriptional regulator